jgi:hypothetical protein
MVKRKPCLSIMFNFVDFFQVVFCNYKTKEYGVVEFIKNKFPNLSWIADKAISGGCSKKRPDLVLDSGHQIVIVEVDENQHRH